MNASSTRARWTGLLAAVGLALGSGLSLTAFPPAPYYTLFGVVRDQVGTALDVEGADVILLRDGIEIGRTPITGDLRLDLNYELNISIEQGRANTRTYSDRTVARQGLFSLAVEMNGETFYPIEADGTLRAGEGGERVRLDLNIGADANGDGLPDAWQEWQLYQAGFRPGDDGWNIDDITRDGDYDGDGTSNFLEYLAGTFAGDAAERFELIITGRTDALVSFEFFAITGKVYAIESSTDLVNWTPVPHRLSPTGEDSDYSRATVVDILPIYVVTEPGAQRFYRITVR
ncbi:hypothetical protein [Actomonas aquatica]|uniref:Discoidin domain-containing protein n=1 Tax=Actomonas aquatica TaxID=2866162 RepID=A0ABZ1C4Q5_9BACT|nr:hypothetical protein [Opitutus sp. WL0086]WRQ86713.1 hypothetical protein K1X11_018020 [Opitutus sp. WL0086]